MGTLRFVMVRLGVLALLVLAAVGLRAGSPTDASDQPWELDLGGLASPVLWVIVVAVVAGTVVPLAMSFKNSGATTRRHRSGRGVRDVLMLAVFVIAALAWPSSHQRSKPPASPPIKDVSGTVSPHHVTTTHLPAVGLAVLALLAVVATLVAARRLHRPAATAMPTADEATELSEGLSAAAKVLREHHDEGPRQRVLSAYEAFESTLAARGLERGPTGTAGALLDRAVLAGAPARAARTLTDLFGKARFSDEPIGEAEVAEAELALGELLASR